MAETVSMDHSSGVPVTQGTGEVAAKAGAMERPEYYLELAEGSMEAVQKMSSSLKFNNEQCVYLADKLKVVVQSGSLFLQKVDKRFSSDDSTGLAEIFKLLVALGKQIESFVEGCCKDAWIQAAMTMTNVSQYVSSLGFNLELCRVAFCVDFAVSECLLSSDEVADINKTEADIVEKKASADKDLLLEKVTETLISSHGEDRDLASYLLQRVLRFGPKPTMEDGTFLSKLFALVEPTKQVGRGASGTVYKAKWLGTWVAKKTFKGLENAEFDKEVKILSRLCHPNITSMFCCAKNRRNCSLVMELMDGDLDQLMERRCDENVESDCAPFPILEAVDIMDQIGEGVKYLHSVGIVHRDLKSQNILYKEVKARKLGIGYAHVKVTDFGVSKTRDKSATNSDLTINVGTSRWMPPEVMKLAVGSSQTWLFLGAEKAPRHPFKVDTYSFGMVCYEILTGHIPFYDNHSVNDIKRRVMKNGERPKLPDECPVKLKTLIEKCWSQKPTERPTFAEICGELKHLKYLLISAKSRMHLDALHKPESNEGDGTGPALESHPLAALESQEDHLTRTSRDFFNSTGQHRTRDTGLKQHPGSSPPKEVGHTLAIAIRAVELLTSSRSETPPPRMTSNGSVDTSHRPSSHSFKTAPLYQSRNIQRSMLPPVKKQDTRNQPASSSHGNRSGFRDTYVYTAGPPPPVSYEDDDTGPTLTDLEMAVIGVKSAVKYFAEALISDMSKYPDELKHLERRIRHEVQGEVDRANHWKFLVQAFVCQRLFESFESNNGFFGIEHFDEFKNTPISSFSDFTRFKDKSATISGLLAKDSDKSFLGLFCFKKFKSISGDLATNLPLARYEEEWSMVDEGRHPRTEFYLGFLKVAVSVWLLHTLVYSFEQEWSMLGWETFPKGCRFEKKNMESVVPGGYEEEDEETGTDVKTVVGFLVIPGFQVGKSVVKCEVYLRNKNSLDNGKIEEASETPSRDKSLEKSFSDKTPANYLTPVKNSVDKSPGSRDSVKSFSIYSGYSSKGDVEGSRSFWDGVKLAEESLDRSSMAQGKSPRSINGHLLPIEDRPQTTSHYLGTQSASASSKQPRSTNSSRLRDERWAKIREEENRRRNGWTN
ncbi:hypothetical protein KC19_6G092800 [Ceratodon purpureus]|uniref:Protein kinase domain-containing protein n=1 Tax=Ceratodon purpureus TaxID=3225 RepID=A0A8T0HH32_CERPU|nr:hypothetical protein KC19_6G092800 [Ceratodon purpureus]